MAVIAALGLGALLMTFPPVRQLGTGLLASAGVAGVIAGFAAQKSLGMIIGGLQLAITEPSGSTMKSSSKANGASSKKSP